MHLLETILLIPALSALTSTRIDTACAPAAAAAVSERNEFSTRRSSVPDFFDPVSLRGWRGSGGGCWRTSTAPPPACSPRLTRCPPPRPASRAPCPGCVAAACLCARTRTQAPGRLVACPPHLRRARGSERLLTQRLDPRTDHGSGSVFRGIQSARNSRIGLGFLSPKQSH